MPFTKESSCIVYRPANYDKAKSYPVIILLHGIGERGDGSLTGLDNLLGFLSSQWNNLQSFLDKSGNYLLVAPQLSAAKGDWDIATVQKGIDYAKSLNVNPKRLYLVGISLGGGGVWRYLSSSATISSLFAAAAVICGVGGWSNLCNIKCPVVAFHASDDSVVGVGNTISAIDGINACNPLVKAVKVIYPDGNHYIWGRVFADVNLWSFFELNEQGSPVPYPVSAPPAPTPIPPPPTPTELKALPKVLNITPTSATLDGSESTGNPTYYLWEGITFPKGARQDVYPGGWNKGGKTINISNLMPGYYLFNLKVGRSGVETSAPVSFTVPSSTQSPVIKEQLIPPGVTKVILREGNVLEFV